ncbi:putative GNAT superfamily acetyltransferase [Cytobacillus eiseniae]|uniref:GNAT superfamily acetyltransferase n=1 Tax=Cytobacillus eiseniae TaxID=762947 RepID=A0ABS4RFX6_9BACI|nr:GNAT family N-acetyltransferase [Cytobacillus eiseniae]MBP2241807.1 putative GNAT superfamily acetyltransferase [Cytobacillus eiseniae]
MSFPHSITYKRIYELDEINKVIKLQEDIWGQETVSPQPQLLASIHHGGIVIGAFAGELLVGFCYGFAGFKDGETYLVSHMTGILPDYQNHGIGYQLKIKQREWAIEFGYKKIVWTYDPLEIRNGYFNMCKLGAYSNHYIPSYYGEMNDKLNKGLPTDRLLIEWEICSKHVEDTIRDGEKDQPESEVKKLLSWNQTEENFPIPELLDVKIDQENKRYCIPVPSNIQFIKQHHSDVALEWRYAVRNAMSKAFANGYMVTRVQKRRNEKVQYYIVENKLLEGRCE